MLFRPKPVRYPRLSRVALLVEVNGDVTAVEVDGTAGELEAVIQYDLEERCDQLFIDPHRLWEPTPPGVLDLRATATFRRGGVSPRFVLRRMKDWPELGADHRCEVRYTPAPGVELRCQRWRGHDQSDEARPHVAGTASWNDLDRRVLA